MLSPVNKSTRLRKWLIATVVCLIFLGNQQFSQESSGIFSFKSSNGLQLKIIKDPYMRFFHAELVIYYKEVSENPAIPHLTLLYLLDPDLNRGGGPLLSILDELGNDIELDHHPDFVTLKINFLPEKQGLFFKFLRELYNQKSLKKPTTPGTPTLAEEKFRNSISNYWKYLVKKKNWKHTLAYQIAYDRLCSAGHMENTLITPKALKGVTFDQIQTFYRNTYQLGNSILAVKGNIANPYLFHGMVEVELKSFKKEPSLEGSVGSKVTINPTGKKVILLNCDTNELPAVFVFEAVPTYFNKINPVPQSVLNHLLFAEYTGKLYFSLARQNIRLRDMATEMVNHTDFTLICNAIENLRYTQLERFLLLWSNEKVKLRKSGVTRNEILYSLRYLFGRVEINSRCYDNNVGIVIANGLNITAAVSRNNLIKHLTPSVINAALAEPDRTLIVIVGNAQLTLSHLTVLKDRIDIIDFGLQP
ncbi:MAG: hypothetical protein ACM3SY_16310 [Candidatus Omnitrophota bacterium]